MLKNILNVSNVQVLEKSEQQSINGGMIYTVRCDFSDGTYWIGNTESEEVYKEMSAHCTKSLQELD